MSMADICAKETEYKDIDEDDEHFCIFSLTDFEQPLQKEAKDELKNDLSFNRSPSSQASPSSRGKMTLQEKRRLLLQGRSMSEFSRQWGRLDSGVDMLPASPPSVKEDNSPAAR